MQTLKLRKQYRSFEGWTRFYSHRSEVCNCDMNFAVYLPPIAAQKPVPVIYWLSGLTCTEENFITKAGAQQFAAQLGVALVAPDTSPRGVNLPGEDESWDFGSGAGFYVNATQEPWSKHYRMYDYITQELPTLVGAQLPVDSARASIFGHSMGGHGALVIGLRNSEQFASISAFAPICAPSQCPWGEKAFEGYLGLDRRLWESYDACKLLAKAKSPIPILVDQGRNDEFLATQLHPGLLLAVAEASGSELALRYQPEYDHSYYFIASFMEDHLRFHARSLGLA